MGCGYPKNVSINVKKEKKNGSFTFELMQIRIIPSKKNVDQNYELYW